MTFSVVQLRAAGNISGEEVLRRAFPLAKLEEFTDESVMVANLSARTNSLGLANNYGVVFKQAERGALSYTLRFPSWQEFYTRQTMRPGGRHLTATILALW
ncbi:hypothetical protein MTO96_017280 [Rhipicephalus appendiculatus]